MRGRLLAPNFATHTTVIFVLGSLRSRTLLLPDDQVGQRRFLSPSLRYVAVAVSSVVFPQLGQLRLPPTSFRCCLLSEIVTDSGSLPSSMLELLVGEAERLQLGHPSLPQSFGWVRRGLAPSYPAAVS